MHKIIILDITESNNDKHLSCICRVLKQVFESHIEKRRGDLKEVCLADMFVE